jgi:hypothetical protein
VLEGIPADLAKRVTETLSIPHHWHRSRPALLRTGVRPARRTGADPSPSTQVRAHLFRWLWAAAGRALALGRGRAQRRIPRTGGVLLPARGGTLLRG